MSSRRFHIIDSQVGKFDGLIKNKNKEIVGYAYNQPAPNGTYIDCSLDGYWLVSDEDYKIIKKYKNEKIQHNNTEDLSA